MSDNRQTPTLAAVILAAMEARLQSFWTALPAQVVAYDPASQLCSAQPVSRQGFKNESGKRQTATLPVVTDVPVAWPRGGGFRLTFPLAPGDFVLLVFSSLAFDTWLLQGGANLDPGDDRRNTLSDAVAIAGIFDADDEDSTTPPTDAASLAHTAVDGATVDVLNDTVYVGGRTGAEPTLKGVAFNSALSDLLAALTAALGSAGLIGPDALTWAAAVTTFETAAAAAETEIAQVV
jgi:hypothetical protein